MQETKQSYIVAGATLLGFTLVAAAIYFSGTGSGVQQPAVAVAPAVLTDDPRREGEQRNVYGSLDAPVTIVEFSDYECPFCARLHPTLKTIVDGSDGQINWEYRHLPLPNHSGALPGAIAAECVAQYAGNEAFWSFSDALLNNQRGITAEFLAAEAVSAGVEEQVYASCITDESIAARVENDAAVAAALGGQGTPFSVVRFADGSSRPVSGALPLTQWSAVLKN